MKRTKIILIVIFILLLSFMVAPVANAYAQTPVERIAGQDRYQTAVAVSREGWTESQYAVLAYGGKFPDAIAAAPLAMKYDAPILLTTKDALPQETRDELQRLGVREVMIVGGTGTVTSGVEAQIKALGIEVTRLAGSDRYETAVKIAEKLGNVQEAMLTTGEDFPDALSVASAAAKKGVPILLVRPNLIPDSVKEYLAAASIKKVYVVGDASIFSEETLKQLPCTYESIYGLDRYEANRAAITQFQDILNSGSFFVATGKDFADALTGSVLAAKKNAPVLLLQDQAWQSAYFIYFKNGGWREPSSYTDAVILGGPGAVSGDAENIFKYYRQVLPEASQQVIFSPFGYPPAIGQVLIAGDWVYYNRTDAEFLGESSAYGENAVYKMKLDGSENSRVFFTGSDIFNYSLEYILNHPHDFSIKQTITLNKVENNYLYYQLSGDNTIYKASAEGSQDNLPTVIRSVQITDDSQPALTWTPLNQETVSSRILAWLKESAPYTSSNAEGILPWDRPENQVADTNTDVHCSRLILTVTDQANKMTETIMIYPRYYQETNGGDREIKFVPEVLTVKNGEAITYCCSPELFDWLSGNQWKSEFHLSK